MGTTWRSTNGRPLPDAGEVFLAPLGRGLYSFCWVVGHAERLNGGDFLTFAFASWVGRRPPTPAEIDAREVLVLHQGPDTGKPHVRKLSEPPPKRWKQLGAVTDPSRGVPPPISYGGFDTFGWYALRDWQWRNDRAQMAADDAAEADQDEAEERLEEKRAKALRDERRTATLAQLARSKTILFEWEGLRGKRDRDAVETILRGLARALAKVAPAAKPAVKRRLLEGAFEAINTWNARRNVIDTPEREALVDALDDIAHAAGLRGRDIGKAWRDW